MTAETDVRTYICTGMQNFQVGDFRFVEGRLELSRDEDIKAFTEMLEKLPLYIRAAIRTVSPQRAQELAAKVHTTVAAAKGMAVSQSHAHLAGLVEPVMPNPGKLVE